MTELTVNEWWLLQYVIEYYDGKYGFDHYFEECHERVDGLLHIRVKDIRHQEDDGYHIGIPRFFTYMLEFIENLASITFNCKKWEFLIVCLNQ